MMLGEYSLDAMLRLMLRLILLLVPRLGERAW